MQNRLLALLVHHLSDLRTPPPPPPLSPLFLPSAAGQQTKVEDLACRTGDRLWEGQGGGPCRVRQQEGVGTQRPATTASLGPTASLEWPQMLLEACGCGGDPLSPTLPLPT